MNKERYEVLDGIRGIAAIIVMVYHCGQIFGAHIFPNAAMGVDLFFILSGFVISHSYGARLSAAGMDTFEYVKKRIIRLYLCFALGVLLGMVLLFSAMSEAGNSLTSTVLNFLFLPSVDDNIFKIVERDASPNIFPGNPPLWSLFFEMVASMAFIALCRFKTFPLFIFACANLILLVAFGFFIQKVQHLPYLPLQVGGRQDALLGGFFRVFYGFALGMILYRVRYFLPKTLTWLKEFMDKIPYSFTMIMLATIAVLAFPWEIGGYFLFGIVVAAPMIVLLGSQKKDVGERQKKICDFLGDISFPLYCIHYPLIVLAFHALSPDVDANYAIIVGISSTLVLLSWMIFRFFDVPVRNNLTRLFARTKKS